MDQVLPAAKHVCVTAYDLAVTPSQVGRQGCHAVTNNLYIPVPDAAKRTAFTIDHHAFLLAVVSTKRVGQCGVRWARARSERSLSLGVWGPLIEVILVKGVLGCIERSGVWRVERQGKSCREQRG